MQFPEPLAGRARLIKKRKEEAQAAWQPAGLISWETQQLVAAVGCRRLF
jgi:hypothetical protein